MATKILISFFHLLFIFRASITFTLMEKKLKYSISMGHFIKLTSEFFGFNLPTLISIDGSSKIIYCLAYEKMVV